MWGNIACFMRDARQVPKHRFALRSGWRFPGMALPVALVGAGMSWPAAAIITEVTTDGARIGIELRVGSIVGKDTVVFDVAGASTYENRTPIAGAPVIGVWISPSRTNTLLATPLQVSLTLDSSIALQCVPGSGCGSTAIPFEKISWVAGNNNSASVGDIQSGTFNNSTNQQIAQFHVCMDWLDDSCWDSDPTQVNALVNTTMQFTYANDVIYPAGVYQGTVTFTATML